MKKTLLFFAILLMQSCGSPQVKTVSGLLGMAVNLVSLLNECQTLSNNFNKDVLEVSQVMQEGIEDNNKSVVDLAKYWEKYWSKVINDYKYLRRKVTEVNTNSQLYFAELEVNNSAIKNKELKAEDATKNSELKTKYEQEYKKAIKSLKEAEKLLQEGNDMMRILRNMVLRENLKDNIIMLKKISSQAEIVSYNINSFSKKCTDLFTSGEQI